MTDEERLVILGGEALASGALLNALMGVMLANGLLTLQSRALIIDEALLGLEEIRALDPRLAGAVDVARDALRSRLEYVPGQPKAGPSRGKTE